MEPDEWRAKIGGPIQAARKAQRLSKRAAAARAGFDEAVWRQIEDGERIVNSVSVPANPRDENLAAAAMAVGLDPAPLFAAAGREYDPMVTLGQDGVLAQIRHGLRENHIREARFVGSVEAQLNELGYEVVEPHGPGGPDLIGRAGGRVLVIEIKSALSPKNRTGQLTDALGRVLQYRHKARSHPEPEDEGAVVVAVVVVPDEPGDDWEQVFHEAGVILTWPPDYEVLQAAVPPPQRENPAAALHGSLDQLTPEELAELRARIDERLGPE